MRVLAGGHVRIARVGQLLMYVTPNEIGRNESECISFPLPHALLTYSCSLFSPQFLIEILGYYNLVFRATQNFFPPNRRRRCSHILQIDR